MENEKRNDVVRVLETFGRYHWYHWLLVSIPSMVQTMANINFVIVAGDLNYRCRIPECDTPESTHKLPIWWPKWNSSINAKCYKPVFDNNSYIQEISLANNYIFNGTCSNSSFGQDIGECTDWIYENNNSIVSEFNLACDPWKINMVGVIHNFGILISLITFGWMSDRFGRKPSFIVTSTGCIIGLLKLASTGYTMFVIVDFIEAFLSGGMYLSTSVMLIEFSTQSTRVYAGLVVANVVCFGEIIMGILAIYFPYWRHLVLIIYATPIIFFSFIFIIKESPKWQVLNGKIDDAKKNIRSIAKINKITINKQELQEIDEEKLKSLLNIKKYEVKDGVKEIFGSKEIMIRLLVGCTCRFTSAFVYYGIMINSALLPGDKNFNFFLSSLMTLPGELVSVYFTRKFGRKMPLIVAYLFSGVVCAASGYIPWTWGKAASFLLGKLLISVCFTGVGTYFMELYPTSTRGLLISINLCASRIGALLAPLTPMLLPISADLPPSVFGAAALLSSILLTLTPETKNMPLFETIEQVENHTKAAKLMKKQMKNKTDDDISEIMQSSDTVVTKL